MAETRRNTPPSCTRQRGAAERVGQEAGDVARVVDAAVGGAIEMQADPAQRLADAQLVAGELAEALLEVHVPLAERHADPVTARVAIELVPVVVAPRAEQEVAAAEEERELAHRRGEAGRVVDVG